MKKVIIFGLNKLSEIVAYHLEKDERYELVAFTVDEQFIDKEVFMEKPIIPFSTLVTGYPAAEYKIILTIGYSNMNNVRMQKFDELRKLHYKVENYIHPSVQTFQEHIGEGNIILENCTIGPFVELGDGNIIYPSTTIAHHTRIGDFNFFSIGCAVAGGVCIQNNSFLGINCTIRDNVKVADYTLVGAGAYIDRNTDAYGAYVPERTIKLEKDSIEFKL